MPDVLGKLDLIELLRDASRFRAKMKRAGLHDSDGAIQSAERLVNTIGLMAHRIRKEQLVDARYAPFLKSCQSDDPETKFESHELLRDLAKLTLAMIDGGATNAEVLTFIARRFDLLLLPPPPSSVGQERGMNLKFAEPRGFDPSKGSSSGTGVSKKSFQKNSKKPLKRSTKDWSSAESRARRALARAKAEREMGVHGRPALTAAGGPQATAFKKLRRGQR